MRLFEGNNVNMENTDIHCKDSNIKEYFLAGFSYTEILAFLSMYHGNELSLRQLHRNLRRLGMFRRKIVMTSIQ